MCGTPYEALADLRPKGSFVHLRIRQLVCLTGGGSAALILCHKTIYSRRKPRVRSLWSRQMRRHEISRIMHDNSFIAMDPPKHVTTAVVEKDVPKAVAAMEPCCDGKAIVDRGEPRQCDSSKRWR